MTLRESVRMFILISLIVATPKSWSQGALQPGGCGGFEPETVLCDVRTGLEWQLSGITTATLLFGETGVTDQGFRIPVCREFTGLLSAASITVFNVCFNSQGLPTLILQDETILDEAAALSSAITGVPDATGFNMHIADTPGTDFPPEGHPQGGGTLRYVLAGPPVRPITSLLIGGVGGSAGNNLPAQWLMVRGQSPDSDQDSVPDASDNCLLVPNEDQFDADFDGFGNLCDTDFNNDCVTNIEDLGLLRAAFFGSDLTIDVNQDGVVNVIDLGVLRTFFFSTPGPSGHTDSCPNR